MRRHRNISFATAEGFEAVLQEGALVSVLASDTKESIDTKELRNWRTVINRPTERCIFLPGRRNDVFGQVAEAMWVIGGRDDVEWLERYVPRAPNYSDDGKVWRAGYGPRLRRWAGQIDQLDEWRKLLLSDPSTRRAAGVLFDPAQDFVGASKDVPCNNWLSWLLRGGELHLTVGIRSNDALWGFSGVNAFEWSVLHQMMASWLNAEVGDVTYLATSYHIYMGRRAEQAWDVVERFYGITPYEFGIKAPAFRVPWADFQAAMSDWFEVEEQIRRSPDEPVLEESVGNDPFLASSLRLLRLKWGSRVWDVSKLSEELAALPEDDFATAAFEFFHRKWPEVLDDIRQPGIRAFFEACEAAKTVGYSALKNAIKHLHARKNKSYAGAWKRRGERVSVLPNIARKVDRLQAIVDEGLALAGETTLDTAVDLYVYALKYRLFLADDPASDGSILGPDAPRPFADHDINFGNLVDEASFSGSSAPFYEQVGALTTKFEAVWRAVDGGAEISHKERWASELAAMAGRLLHKVVAANERSARNFIREELGS